MRFQIRFNPEQTVNLMYACEAFEERALHMKPALRFCTQLFLDREQARFTGANNWVPDTPLTQAYKDAVGKPQQGVWTGMLRRSLAVRRGTAKGASTFANDRYAILGTSAPHAHLFAKGTNERRTKKGAYRGRMPARSLSFIETDQTAQFYSVLENYLLTGEVGGVTALADLGI